MGPFYAFLLLFSFSILAQDERLVRKLLDGTLSREKFWKGLKKEHFISHSRRYYLISTVMGPLESFSFSKKDGEDWFFIYGNDGGEIFRYSFEVLGWQSQAYRMDIMDLSKNHRVFLIYFFEGKVGREDLLITSRLYFLSLKTRNLTTLSLKKGPLLWEEHQQREHYHLRANKVWVSDLDRDGVREILLKGPLRTQVIYQVTQSKGPGPLLF